MRIRWLLSALAVVVVLTVALRQLQQARQAETVTARKGNIVHSFVALGRVESDITVDISPEFTARIHAVHVCEGDRVQPGQLLAKLDDSRLQAEYEEARHALAAATARRDETRRGTRPEVIARAKQLVEEAHADVELAQAKLQETIRGARPEELAQADAQVALALAEVTYAEKQLQRHRGLDKLDWTTESHVDQLQRQFDVGQALLRKNQAQRDLLANGATEEELRQARAQVATARARLAQAEIEWEQFKTGATAEERQRVEEESKQAQAVLDHVRVRLAETELTAPMRAVVIRRYLEPGDVAHPQYLPSHPVLVLASAEPPQIRVEVTEHDIYKLRLGQSAVVTSDGYVGRQWKGKVTRIAPVMGKKALFSENPKEKVDVKILEAWITPDQPLKLPLNLPVEAKITEVLRRDTLVIPNRFLDTVGRVHLASGEIRQVQIGAKDDAFVEILTGLQEGDRLIAGR